MKTKILIVIVLAFLSMSYTSSETTMSKDSKSTLITTTSIDDDLNCPDSGVYFIHIVWVNDITPGEKNTVRHSFNIYGRSILFQTFPDGSEQWAFILDNMNPSVVVTGQCRSETVDDEIEDHEEVDVQRVRNPNR